jgi:hypothetical protein
VEIEMGWFRRKQWAQLRRQLQESEQARIQNYALYREAQATVDRARSRIRDLESAVDANFQGWQQARGERDELQRRIDEAVSLLAPPSSAQEKPHPGLDAQAGIGQTSAG